MGHDVERGRADNIPCVGSFFVCVRVLPHLRPPRSPLSVPASVSTSEWSGDCPKEIDDPL